MNWNTMKNHLYMSCTTAAYFNKQPDNHVLSLLPALMQKKPKSYSPALMDQIPIKHLIRQAQGLQQELGCKGHPLTSIALIDLKAVII